MADWVQEVLRKQQESLSNIEKGTQVSVPMLSRAPGWIFIKEEISCIPDSVYPWDKSVVREILRWSGGNIVPIWVKRVYRTPFNEAGVDHVVFGRHGLGQLGTLHSPLQNFPCSMPVGARFKRPTHIYWVPWGEADPRARDLPGAYIPFDSRFLKYVKDNYREPDIEAIKIQIEARYDLHEANLQKAKLQHDQMAADIRKYAAKKLQTVSDSELKEYFLGRYHKRSTR